MAVPKELTGTYRQVAWKLRIQKDVGAGPHKESVRPRKGKRGPYLDDDEPTLIEIEEDDAIDVESLLAQGGIVKYTPPKPKRNKKKGGDDGKAGSE